MNQQQKDAFFSVIVQLEKMVSAGQYLPNGSAQQFQKCQEHLAAAVMALQVFKRFCSADDPILVKAQNFISDARNLFETPDIV